MDSTEKKPTVSLVGTPKNFGELRKMVKMAERMSYADGSPLDMSFGTLTITAWLRDLVVPRGKGVQ